MFIVVAKHDLQESGSETPETRLPAGTEPLLHLHEPSQANTTVANGRRPGSSAKARRQREEICLCHFFAEYYHPVSKATTGCRPQLSRVTASRSSSTGCLREGLGAAGERSAIVSIDIHNLMIIFD